MPKGSNVAEIAMLRRIVPTFRTTLSDAGAAGPGNRYITTTCLVGQKVPRPPHLTSLTAITPANGAAASMRRRTGAERLPTATSIAVKPARLQDVASTKEPVWSDQRCQAGEVLTSAVLNKSVGAGSDERINNREMAARSEVQGR